MSKPTFKYGVSAYSYFHDFGVDMNLRDIALDIADMGATGFEILGDGHVKDYPTPSSSWIDSWKALLDETGLEATCYGSWVDTTRYAGRVLSVDEMVDQLTVDINLASELGFKFIRPKFGVVDEELSPHPQWLEATERVLDLAHNKNIVVTTEVHFPSTLQSRWVGDAIELIEKTGTKNFGLLIDTGVFHSRPYWDDDAQWVKFRLGEGEALEFPDLPPVPANEMKDVLQYTPHIQAKFYYIDDDLHDDYIPWRDIVTVLAEAEWDGYLSSEYEGKRDFYLAPDQLRRQHALIRSIAAELS